MKHETYFVFLALLHDVIASQNHFPNVLVPTLVILLRPTDTVLWDKENCSAHVQKSVKFDVGSEDNRKALNFITYDRLTSTVLPNLRDQLELIQQNETGN